MSAGDSPNFPSEITFKSVFRTGHETAGMLKQVFSEFGLECLIYSKKSSNGTFISFTITARFSSEDELRDLCSRIRSLDGFMTMF